MIPQVTAIRPHDIERPVLDLSGDALRAAMQQMVAGSEEHGGVERYIDAVKLKSDMFRQALGGIESGELELETFKGLCTFMSTVRRRVGNWLNTEAFEDVREGLTGLFDESISVDGRISEFCARFPDDKAHRWVRDLATEMLHNRENCMRF